MIFFHPKFNGLIQFRPHFLCLSSSCLTHIHVMSHGGLTQFDASWDLRSAKWWTGEESCNRSVSSKALDDKSSGAKCVYLYSVILSVYIWCQKIWRCQCDGTIQAVADFCSFDLLLEPNMWTVDMLFLETSIEHTAHTADLRKPMEINRLQTINESFIGWHELPEVMDHAGIVRWRKEAKGPYWIQTMGRSLRVLLAFFSFFNEWIFISAER